MTEALTDKEICELKALRQRRCTNCGFYAYYDGPLCGLNDVTEVGFLFPRNPDTWYCADWKPEETSEEGVGD